MLVVVISTGTASLAVTSPSRSATFRSLVTFIEQSGGLVAEELSDGIDSATGVRGLFVTNAVAKGEPLLVLPPGSYIGASDDDDVSDGAGPLKTFERLIVHLLDAKHNESESPLRPYLDSMPTHVPMLRDWSVEDLQLLH